MNRRNRRTPIFASVTPSELGRELIRTDVIEAVCGAFSALNSPVVTTRMLAQRGDLDARCTSNPVALGAL